MDTSQTKGIKVGGSVDTISCLRLEPFTSWSGPKLMMGTQHYTLRIHTPHSESPIQKHGAENGVLSVECWVTVIGTCSFGFNPWFGSSLDTCINVFKICLLHTCNSMNWEKYHEKIQFYRYARFCQLHIQVSVYFINNSSNSKTDNLPAE